MSERLISLSSSSSSLSSRDRPESKSQQSSRDVSSAVFEQEHEVHDHILPPGWVCYYDIETKAYKFDQVTSELSREKPRKPSITDHVMQTSRRPTLHSFECKYGYHFPESPTSSMISDLAKLVDKQAPGPSTAKKEVPKWSELSSESNQEQQLKRLQEMFPTATAPILEQMIRVYQGREGLIKAALISLGYKRSRGLQTKPADVQNAIMLMMAKPSSKKLYDKLVSYFPDKDTDTIKNLMYELKEIEHEIISALVSSSTTREIDDTKTKSGVESKRERDGATMKLRYLRYLFPDCEEIELYYLLYCHDLKVQNVIAEMEKQGHKRANVDEAMKNRKLQQSKARQPRPKPDKDSATRMVESHKSRPRPRVDETKTKTLVDKIQQLEPEAHSDEVIRIALQAADYNDDLAKRFLDDLGPIDEEQFKRRYVIEHGQDSRIVLFPCKGTQKDDSGVLLFTFDEYVEIPKEVIECKTALALLKTDASTWTLDDFVPAKATCAKGRNLDLVQGSIFETLEKRESLRLGPNRWLRYGSNYEHICDSDERPKPNAIAKGSNKKLRKGPSSLLKRGHNSSLVERIHPFFVSNY